MPTTGIVNGHNLRIFVGGTAVAKATNCQITITREVRNTSHKDIGSGDGAGWAGSEYGEGSWEISGDALYAESEGFETLWSAMKDKTKVAIEYSTDVTGDQRFTGNVVMTSLEMNAANNEDVTYSYAGTGDGEPTREAVPV